jgi:hypothetical protein
MMLRRFHDLRGYSLRATDDSLGSVTDILFDDESWKVRWLVADTAWLFGRRVLLAPQALGVPDDIARELPVKLTKARIKNAPDVDTDMPVSRQQETTLYNYYGWSPYWHIGALGTRLVPPLGLYPAVGGPGPNPEGIDEVRREAADQEVVRHDPHLRSGRQVTGYHIRATDDPVGHVEDILIGEDDWAIRYLLVDTRNWLPGRNVLIATTWVRGVSWPDREVSLEMTRHQVESSPEYEEGEGVQREYEDRLHRHYGRVGYWA